MEEDKRSKVHSIVHVETPDKDATDISDVLMSKFDYVIKRNMYSPHKDSLVVYDLMRQIFYDKDNKLKTPIITLSSDQSISSSTISGVCEKYMYVEGKGEANIYRSDLKVIYIDASPDLSTKKFSNYNDFGDAVVSNALGLMNSSYTKHNVNLEKNNIYFLGVNEDLLDDEMDSIMRRESMNVFTLKQMRAKGIVKIIEYIIDQCMYDNVHIVLDLCALSKRVAPSVFRNNKDGVDDGFDYDEIKIIMNGISKLKRLNSFDITGYNFGNKEDKNKYYVSNMMTVKAIETVLSSLVDLQQRSINVFNENSKFLIWKRLDDKNPIGWLILRGMSLEQREEIIRELEEDSIVNIPIEDDGEVYDALVTTTTMKEQQEKSYYTSNNIYDCCLYPGEKLNMMFEIINTTVNDNSDNINASNIPESTIPIKLQTVVVEGN